jgi:hypothetical protein
MQPTACHELAEGAQAVGDAVGDKEGGNKPRSGEKRSLRTSLTLTPDL